MLIYAGRAQRHLGDLTREQIVADELRQDALERAIELIGEAAGKIGGDTKAKLAEVPWREIVRTRHIVAHDYGSIDHGILIDIVRQHLPPLIAAIERLLAEEPE